MASTAPAELDLVRQFVNTRDVEEGLDELSTPAALAAWLSKQELDGGKPSRRDVQRFVDAREGLRALLLANNGEPLDGAAVERLDAAARSVSLRLRFEPGVELEGAQRGPAGALAEILAAVYRAMQEGTWPRLKACRADTCQWAFYDNSRNRSGAWCSMEVCGNRAKARSYRRRHGGHRHDA